MNLFGWLKQLTPKRERAPEAVLSGELAQRIAAKAESLQECLGVYHRSKDPFAAMMADLYNRDQVSRIWKSGKG